MKKEQLFKKGEICYIIYENLIMQGIVDNYLTSKTAQKRCEEYRLYNYWKTMSEYSDSYRKFVKDIGRVIPSKDESLQKFKKFKKYKVEDIPFGASTTDMVRVLFKDKKANKRFEWIECDSVKKDPREFLTYIN